MKKETHIHYNPYDSTVNIRTALTIGSNLKELDSDSRLIKYSNIHVLFSNCVKDIVTIINEDHNTTKEGLEISFSGPRDDYVLLEKAVSVCEPNGAGGVLSCRHIELYESANDVIDTIKKYYKKISDVFSDYMPGNTKYEMVGHSIGDTISNFNEITSHEIPICVIGTYSVGKSALINAFIGDEILPSKEDPNTAKNAKIIRSENYWIEFDYKRPESDESTTIKLNILDGDLTIDSAFGPDKEFAQAICDSIRIKINANNKTRAILLHDTIDFFNGPADTDILKNIQYNITIGVPFAQSVLTETNERIIFYDTPGSNNADVNQQTHKEALKSLMSGQTNALPILVTTRDNIMADDVAELKQLLDDYSENFSCTNCIIVCSKGDEMVTSQLKQDFKPQIKDWHGGTAIMFATPIGAIGERKTNNNSWLDHDYQDLYSRWKNNMTNDRIILPDYNLIPCADRKQIASVATEDDIYATGIPSIELEILYYIKNYANYRKCVRGKDALEKAIESVKEEIKKEKNDTEDKEKNALTEKENRRKELINELNKIQVKSLVNEGDNIEGQYKILLDTYIDGLTNVMSILYDELVTESALNMDRIFNERMKEHCQKELIDRCYLGKNGIQKAIKLLMTKYANEYIDNLKSFVSKNSDSLTISGRRYLEEYIDKEIQIPSFKDINSIIDDINDFFEKGALVTYGISKRVSKDHDKAKFNWISVKKKSFEKKLRGSSSKYRKHGKFRVTAINKPLEEYQRQFVQWSNQYREHIKIQLDESNIVLSGLEEEIQNLHDSVDDLESRLSRIADVEDTLSVVMELRRL